MRLTCFISSCVMLDSEVSDPCRERDDVKQNEFTTVEWARRKDYIARE